MPFCPERAPKKLSALKNRRIKQTKQASPRRLRETIAGNIFVTLKQALQTYRHDREIEAHLKGFASLINADQFPPLPTSGHRKTQRNEPDFDLHTHLYRIIRTDLCQVDGISAITVHVFFSEVGADIGKFPTVNHFYLCLGLCPQNKISSGKVLSSRTRPGASRLAQVLRMASQALRHRHSSLGEYLRRMKARHGAPKAMTATAHKLARMIYHLVKTGRRFDETSFADEEVPHRKRSEKRLRNQAKTLCFQIVPCQSQK